jgi:hypothetical protein
MEQHRRSASDRERLATEFLKLADECEGEIDPDRADAWSDNHVRSPKHLLQQSSLLDRADKLIVEAIRAGWLTAPVDPWQFYLNHAERFRGRPPGQLLDRTTEVVAPGHEGASWRMRAAGCRALAARIRESACRPTASLDHQEIDPRYEAVKEIVLADPDIKQKAIQDKLKDRLGTGINHELLRDMLDRLRAEGIYAVAAKRRQ